MDCSTPAGGWILADSGAPIHGNAAITISYPEPYHGYGAGVFSRGNEWMSRFVSIAKRSLGVDAGIECVKPLGSGYIYGDPVSLWFIQLTLSGEVALDDLERALESALDNPNMTELVDPDVSIMAAYVGHQTENPMPRLIPKLDGVMHSFENAVGQVAALAVLALAIVVVSRFWPLGGMALLAALLIVVLNDERSMSNAQAQA